MARRGNPSGGSEKVLPVYNLKGSKAGRKITTAGGEERCRDAILQKNGQGKLGKKGKKGAAGSISRRREELTKETWGASRGEGAKETGRRGKKEGKEDEKIPGGACDF